MKIREKALKKVNYMKNKCVIQVNLFEYKYRHINSFVIKRKKKNLIKFHPRKQSIHLSLDLLLEVIRNVNISWTLFA